MRKFSTAVFFAVMLLLLNLQAFDVVLVDARAASATSTRATSSTLRSNGLGSQLGTTGSEQGVSLFIIEERISTSSS